MLNTYTMLPMVLKIKHSPVHKHVLPTTHAISCGFYFFIYCPLGLRNWIKMSRKIHACCSERAKHMTGSLDLRESVELIDSRIPQRQHSQERHEADSSPPLSLGFGLIKTSKWVNNIIWLEIFSFRKEIIIFNFLVSSCCVNISETVKCMWFCMEIRNSFYYKAFYMTRSIHASKEILTQQADVAFTCLLASEGPFWRAHADKVLNPFTTWAPGISLVIKQQSFASCSYIFF